MSWATYGVKRAKSSLKYNPVDKDLLDEISPRKVGNSKFAAKSDIGVHGLRLVFDNRPDGRKYGRDMAPLKNFITTGGFGTEISSDTLNDLFKGMWSLPADEDGVRSLLIRGKGVRQVIAIQARPAFDEEEEPYFFSITALPDEIFDEESFLFFYPRTFDEHHSPSIVRLDDPSRNIDVENSIKRGNTLFWKPDMDGTHSEGVNSTMMEAAYMAAEYFRGKGSDWGIRDENQ